MLLVLNWSIFIWAEDKLYVGQHLRCMIDVGARLDLLAGETRTINICVDPVQMRNAQVRGISQFLN